VGQTLTAVTGTWAPTPDSYLYQWNRAGAAISGATAATYTLVTADIGTVTVTVTAVKSGYTSTPATSSGVTVVAAAQGATQLTETFTGTDGSPWPSQWTQRAGDGVATIVGNQGQIVTTTTSGSYATMMAVSMTPSTNQELYAEFVTPSAGHIVFFIDTQLFAYTYPDQGYWLDIVVGSGTQSKKATQGSGSVQMSYIGTTIAASTAYKARFSRTTDGTGAVSVQYRLWLASAAEPSTWAMTYADATPLAAGRVALSVQGSGVISRTATFDNITVV
jgi:hypothetical protein